MEDFIGFVHLFVEVHLPDDAVQQTLTIVGVIDGKIGRIADMGCLRPQDAGKNGVKSTCPDSAGALPDHSLDAGFHLSGRFVGKGKRQNLPRRHALLNQVGNPVREYACLAGSRPGNDEHRAFSSGHSGQLHRIKGAEISLRLGIHEK